MPHRLLCLTVLLCVSCSPQNPGKAASHGGRAHGPATATIAAAVAENRVIGTIRATFDGEERAWYVLEGTVNDERQSGAFWYAPDSRQPRAMISGYDTPDVPFDTFGRPEAPTGEYPGSVITLMIAFEPGQAPGSIPLPADGDTAVLYMPSAAEGPLFAFSDGRLEVTTLETPRPGTGSIAGTFSGTMTRSADGSEPIAVADGRFEIAELEYRESLPGARRR